MPEAAQRNSVAGEKAMRERKKRTYKTFLTENLLAPCCKLDGHHTYLPAVIAAAYGGAERAPENLVPEADANDADAGLGEEFLGEGYEGEDPGVVVVGIVLCWRVSVLFRVYFFRCNFSLERMDCAKGVMRVVSKSGGLWGIVLFMGEE